ncbi:hypothetical protein X777_11973 [Ooceraea biroi]|uniref:DDE Tnp4 domain-containing protein n=1 Tax=Ooceraea biroi TaxID=2015173 RepID=A0A026X3V2_OOCBI|nr:hypothetical protein X777_11973 [Ooceraea biroi]
MTKETFSHLLQMTKPFLTKTSKRAFSPEQRLAITLRLSRARRTIENSFDILSSRWRIYRKLINMHPKYMDTVVMATICCHVRGSENVTNLVSVLT